MQKSYFLNLKMALFSIIFGKNGRYGLRYRIYYYFRGMNSGERDLYDKKIGARKGINKGKKFVIIDCGSATTSGVGSYITVFLTHLARWEKKAPGRIPILVMPEPAYDALFEPFSPYSLQEVYSSADVILGGYCYKDLLIYRDEIKSVLTSDKNIQKYYELFHRYFHFSSEVKKHFDREFDAVLKPVRDNGKKVLGVKFRQSDYVCFKAQNHAVQPPLEDMANLVAEYMAKYGYAYLFLAVEENKSREYFRSKFGDKLLYCENILADFDVHFVENYYTFAEAAAEKKGKRKAEEDYLIDILLLSTCDALLASDTSGTRVAIILNGGKYERRKIIDHGYNKEDSEDFKKLLTIREKNEGGHI